MQTRKSKNAILVSQTRYSSLGQILLTMLMCYSVTSLPDHQWSYYPMGTLFVINFLRVVCIYFHPRTSDERQKIWYSIYGGLIVLSAIGWGSSCSYMILNNGLTTIPTVTLLTLCAGLSAGATVTLASDRILAQSFVLCMLSPLIYVTAFALNPPVLVLSLIGLANLVFLSAQISVHGKLIWELKSKKGQLRAFADATMEAIVIHDEGRILEVNPSFERLFQYTSSELIGKNFSDLTPAEDHDHNREIGFRDRTVPLETRGLKKDGSIFHIEVVGRWFLYEGRKVRVTCIVDVSHRKQAEEVIRDRERAALESAQVKSQFLANMSHEIRTPLNVIIGITDMLSEAPADDKQNKYFKMLKGSSEGLLHLVNDILDFSKIDAGKIELEEVDFNLAGALEGQVNLLMGKAKEQGIELRMDIESGLPVKVKGDYSRLGQVILNLVNNAIKFTPKGHVDISLRKISQSQEKLKVRFAIRDTGIGIEPEKMSKLFKPFTQADNSTARKHGGTGLGLSICQKIVTLMGGEIGFESEYGSGTTFWFELEFPIVQNFEIHTDAKDVCELVQEKSRNKGKLSGARILVAEDHSINQMIILTILQQLGHHCQVVGNGNEVIDAYNLNKYDLILMDCQMPEVDGFEATRRIRQLEAGGSRQIPIIALTANAFKEDRDRCLDSGMDDFLTKPIRKEKLVETLQKHLQAKLAS